MPELETDEIQYRIEDTTAIITFNRPDKYNSLTTEMFYSGAEAIRMADEDDDVRAIIVTGAGDKAFCAGADLEDRLPTVTGDQAYDPNPLFFKDEMVTTPIISAVNGYCTGGGMEFIQFTDIRIGEEHAEFGLPEANWGLIPGGGSTARLPRQIPYAQAMEFLLTGETFDAEHAKEVGLINEVVPSGDSLERAKEIADTIAEGSPHAVSLIKESVVRGLNRSMNDALRLETENLRKAFRHEDSTEGPRAYKEDREPAFRA
jgi:enoyl-CoA hydratase/carnithine racemase